MASAFRRCLAAAAGVAGLLVAPAHAEDAGVVAKQVPTANAGPAPAAAPQRVSPYAKYAREHGDVHRGETAPRVSGLSTHKTHRVPRRSAQ